MAVPSHLYNNANSQASGGCNPHFKSSPLIKPLPFHPHFCLTKHIDE